MLLNVEFNDFMKTTQKQMVKLRQIRSQVKQVTTDSLVKQRPRVRLKASPSTLTKLLFTPSRAVWRQLDDFSIEHPARRARAERSTRWG